MIPEQTDVAEQLQLAERLVEHLAERKGVVGSEIINQLWRNIIGHSLGKTSTPRCAAVQYYVLCLICSLGFQAFRVFSLVFCLFFTDATETAN